MHGGRRRSMADILQLGNEDDNQAATGNGNMGNLCRRNGPTHTGLGFCNFVTGEDAHQQVIVTDKPFNPRQSSPSREYDEGVRQLNQVRGLPAIFGPKDDPEPPVETKKDNSHFWYMLLFFLSVTVVISTTSDE